jgi:nucleotide-binding universal stress UspA family protein
MTNRIVVGIDGSRGSLDALRWAIDEAELRDAAVTAVISWQVPAWFVLEGGGKAEQQRLAEAFGKTAASTLEEAVADALGSRAVPVEQRVVDGSAVAALLDAADGADLLVVGSRGLGGFRGLLLGSVSSQCVQHAPCPVVVIPRAAERD